MYLHDIWSRFLSTWHPVSNLPSWFKKKSPANYWINWNQGTSVREVSMITASHRFFSNSQLLNRVWRIDANSWQFWNNSETCDLVPRSSFVGLMWWETMKVFRSVWFSAHEFCMNTFCYSNTATWETPEVRMRIVQQAMFEGGYTSRIPFYPIIWSWYHHLS